MEDIEKIILNSKKSKLSVDKEVLLDVDLVSNETKFPVDGIISNIDQYKQYVTENDSSNKYRFVFTINPVCSNVLFNRITEIVKDEGSSKCCFYGMNGVEVSDKNNVYVKYKYGDSTALTRDMLIRDTTYSHPYLGNLVYHCGLDIFNNHTLRRKQFTIINFLSNSVNKEERKHFNEIGDYVREFDGNTIELDTLRNDDTSSYEHVYYKDTLNSFNDTLFDKLIEEDGWFGFKNPTGLEINNVNDYSVNKCMNNNKACEFIDLYPDRSLFSFIPKENKSRSRLENNWDYCLTYPFENYTGNTLVSLISSNNNQILNGILSEFCDSNNELIDSIIDLIYPNNTNESGRTIDENRYIIIRTKFKHNLISGNYVRIHLVGMSNGNRVFRKTKNKCLIKSVGYNGYNQSYYFTISINDILNDLLSFYKKYGDIINLECYSQRISTNNRPCKYYFRKFKRIPKFNNGDFYQKDGLTNEDIDNNCLNDFNSSLNKLGFSNNIYNDKIAQIIYNDTIDLTNLKDNLGRDLHEVFLTIVKRNVGYNKWYNGNYNDSTIEFSHCFGEVTSGIEMPPYSNDYNVHKIHNVNLEHKDDDLTLHILPDNYKPLEKNITKNGSNTFNNEKGVFLGDIIELDEDQVEEVVLETVCHRFNTIQREIVSDEFSKLLYDEIVTDDFDTKFEVAYNKSYTNDYRANIAPEGYYYKAHYGILLKRFKDEILEGQHTFVKFDSVNVILSGSDTRIYQTITDRNYYFQNSDEIYIYCEGVKYVGYVFYVGGNDFREVNFRVVCPSLEITKCDFIKPNSLKPSNAYDFDDGSGIYKWREFESCANIKYDDELFDTVFTNDAHYFHKNINFFLRRQDPIGLYGLNPIGNPQMPQELIDLSVEGEEKDITNAEVLNNGENTIC